MKRIHETLRNEKGFTLVELLVVIGIIGILAMMLLPQFGGMRDRARIASCQSNLKNISTQIESFYADRERYPDGTEWTDNFASLGIASCPHDLSAYTYTAGATVSGPASGATDIYAATDITSPNPALVAGAGVRIDTYLVQCTFHDGSGATEPEETQLIVTQEGVERRPQ
jgi:prepilin-type N-terminal cleavage/methylation domain-containing protein